MIRGKVMVLFATISFVAFPLEACLVMGANFWNVAWDGGRDQYYGVCPNWSPAFIAKLQDFKCLRFMDWNAVNNTAATSWANRSTNCGEFNGNSNAPVAYEYQIDVVNRVPGCGYWLNVPAGADSQYCYNLGMLVCSKLQPGRLVYLEYANETWWEQASHGIVTAAGQSLGLTSAGSNQYTVKDSTGSTKISDYFLGHVYLAARMWHWFRAGFKAAGGSEHLCVRVLAGQAGYGGAEECHGMLVAAGDKRVNPFMEKCDLYAIAPYGDAASNEGAVSQHATFCKQHNVGLCCYEGGPGDGVSGAGVPAYLAMLDKYINGPFNQYTLHGWGGADEGGYLGTLNSWATSHTCAPAYTSEDAVRNPFKSPASAELSKLTKLRGSKLYTLDGRPVASTIAARWKPGCYVSVRPESGSRMVVLTK